MLTTAVHLNIIKPELNIITMMMRKSKLQPVLREKAPAAESAFVREELKTTFKSPH
jgi:hypothetical protein